MKGRIRIKSRGCTATRTKVMLGGKQLMGVRSVEILPITAGGLVEARITVLVGSIDIETKATLTEESPT